MLTLRSWSRFLANWTTRIAFPATCAGCGVGDTWLCSHCFRQVQRIDTERSCQRCGLPAEKSVSVCVRCSGWNDSLDSVRTVFAFTGPVRRAIHLMKYSGQVSRSRWFGKELAPVFFNAGWSPDFMTSVPLTAARLRERGFNQAGKIAEATSLETMCRYKEVVLKVRETQPQTGLTRAQRYGNVQDAFEAPGDYTGQTIVLLDDVVTTGATLLACAEALKKSGATTVYGLTVATGMIDSIVQSERDR